MDRLGDVDPAAAADVPLAADGQVGELVGEAVDVVEQARGFLRAAVEGDLGSGQEGGALDRVVVGGILGARVESGGWGGGGGSSGGWGVLVC